MDKTHIQTEESYKKLRVWQQAHSLVLEVYRLTSSFPQHEQYSLVSQMRRSAISVPANIVEGSKRKTSKDRQHFNVIAIGSLEELKYYFVLCGDLGYCDEIQVSLMTDKARAIGAMLHGLNNSLS